MKNYLKHMLKTQPYFLVLLPLFFVLHGCLENFDFIPFGDAAILALIYLGWSLAFAGLFWLLYRDTRRAAFIAFLLMAYNFFFGSVHDVLRKWFPNGLFSKHLFILPFSIIVLLTIIIVLKKKKLLLLRTTHYLNILLLVLLLIDGVLLSGKIIAGKKNSLKLPSGYVLCDTCAKPDIYFILADEYAGNTELKDLFNFDDSSFINALQTRGFHHIRETHSNYNYTPFSVASILNMNYLPLTSRVRDNHSVFKSYGWIRYNTVLQFLQVHGYQFYNYSVFDFDGQPARVRETFIPLKTRLITAQTFVRRFDKEIRFNLLKLLHYTPDLKKLTYDNRNNNQHIYDGTWKLAERQTDHPRFVYTHLMMPHYPYYFDSAGRERPYEELLEGNQTSKSSYKGYLQYSNKKYLELIDHILSSSTKPPIIIFMGDHGFRHFDQPVDAKYYFLNFSAIHLPGKNYDAFRDSLNGVNFFRTLLNNNFGQHLPYLRDSTSYLQD